MAVKKVSLSKKQVINKLEKASEEVVKNKVNKEEIRLQAAMAALSGLLANSNYRRDSTDFVVEAFKYADKFIEKI